MIIQLYTLSTSQILWFVTIANKRKKYFFPIKVVAMTKINIIVWQHKFVIDCQEISFACNLFGGDGHHKNDVVKFVAIHKIN